MQNSIYLDAPAHQAALSHHFGRPDTTIILSEVPIGRTVRQRQCLRVPDLLVAFGVEHAGVLYRHGYSIEAQGKPPDFVLEVASVTTGQNDYTQKRDDYAAFGVPEYWRFDPSGGEYHDAPLAGDHLGQGSGRPGPAFAGWVAASALGPDSHDPFEGLMSCLACDSGVGFPVCHCSPQLRQFPDWRSRRLPTREAGRRECGHEQFSQGPFR